MENGIKKVSFLCEWGKNSKELCDFYTKMTPNCSGIWNNLLCTDDIFQSDYLVILENLPEDFSEDDFNKIDFQKTLYVRREPTFIHRGNRVEDKTFLNVNYKNFFHICDWQMNKSFDFLDNLKPPEKSKKLVCIISGKTFTKEHIKRLNFLKKLCNKYPNKIDLYGRQFAEKDIVDLGISYKGELKNDGDCKYLGLIDYEYCLSLENNKERNYFTEKICDAFLAWSIPIYYGCPNLSDYFYEKSYYEIDIGDEDRSIEYIMEIIKKPVSKVDLCNISISRKKILYEYSFWPALYTVLNRKRGTMLL